MIDVILKLELLQSKIFGGKEIYFIVKNCFAECTKVYNSLWLNIYL